MAVSFVFFWSGNKKFLQAIISIRLWAIHKRDHSVFQTLKQKG